MAGLHPDLEMLLDFFRQQRSAPPEAYSHARKLVAAPSFFSIDKLQQHLNNPLLTPDWIALSYKGEFVPLEPAHMYKDVQNKQLFFMDKALIERELARGAALLLEGLDILDPAINAFAGEIDSALPCALTNVVAFFSQRGNEAYKGHSDLDDVLVMHMHGRKRWNLFERLPRSGRRGGLTKAQMGRQIAEITLEPGDALYLRSGVPHLCETVAECSLHVSFDLRDRTPNLKQITEEANKRYASDQAEPYADPREAIERYVRLLASEPFGRDVTTATHQIRNEAQAFRQSIGKTSSVRALSRFSP